MQMEQFVEREHLVQKIEATLIQSDAPEDVMVGFSNQPQEIPYRLKPIDSAEQEMVTIFQPYDTRRPIKEGLGERVKVADIIYFEKS